MWILQNLRRFFQLLRADKKIPLFSLSLLQKKFAELQAAQRVNIALDRRSPLYIIKVKIDTLGKEWVFRPLFFVDSNNIQLAKSYEQQQRNIGHSRIHGKRETD